MRSVAGRVLFQPPASPGVAAGAESSPAPKALAGVRVTAGGAEAKTAGEGCFVLRALPAGGQLLPAATYEDTPPSLRLPEGRFKMAFEPAAVEGITITNPMVRGSILPAGAKPVTANRAR